MRFTKMQGIGNDYIYVDCFDAAPADPAALARRISDRHFGVGGDGLILILPSEQADVRMRIFNADGSEAQMCGNGIRCLAKYAYEHGLARKNPMRVQTGAGIKEVALAIRADGRVESATVDMGEPIFEPDRIPVRLNGADVLALPLEAGGRKFTAVCLSMGNPHAVIFTDDVDAVPLGELGPAIENDEHFPQRVNVHFAQVLRRDEIRMHTWERGSGRTLACGTGACAACVAAARTGRADRRVIVHLPGGDLRIEWREDDNHVYMTGPAQEVFTGDWPDESGRPVGR